eukprot:6179888-Pleurochrysis_carterae.AAC.2
MAKSQHFLRDRAVRAAPRLDVLAVSGFRVVGLSLHALPLQHVRGLCQGGWGRRVETLRRTGSKAARHRQTVAPCPCWARRCCEMSRHTDVKDA